MAHIEKRKTGYRAQVRRKGARSVSRTFDLLADAQAWSREMEREVQRGNMTALLQEAQRITLGEIADRYLAGPVAGMRSGGTISLRIRLAKKRFGRLFLANVRPIDIAGWRDALGDDGLSPQSVILHLAALSAMFSYAEKELGITLPAGNPVRGVRRPAQPKARDRRLRQGELDYLLDAARVPGVAIALDAFIILAVETSMRMGELVALRWNYIDLKARTAHVPISKNDESRTVALSPAAVKALQSVPRRIDGQVWNWRTASGCEAIWLRCRARAQRSYAATCAEQKIKPDPRFLADLRFHDLRHEAASRLFEKGLGIMEVASMTGHKSLAMLKRYTHVEAAKLAQKLG